MKNKAIQKEFRFLKELLLKVLNRQGLHGLHSESLKYFRTLEIGEESRGAQSMVLRAKHVYHATLNAMLGQPDPEYPFLATHKGGPRCVLGFRRYADTVENRRLVLTILSVFRALVVPGRPDFESITRPGVPVHPDLINAIAQRVKPLELVDSPEYQLRTKVGPNGKAVFTAPLDALALKQDPSLDRALKGLLTLQGCDLIKSDLERTQEIVESKSKVSHSRLSFKYEAGGKVRIFAICDYYSQIALKPLHKAVARILRKLPQDFTGDQEGISEQITKGREEGHQTFGSIDLSSATDRFPAILQKKVVEKLTSVQFSEFGYDLMTKRDFDSPQGKIRYQVGQPMGAYSSGPVFAFSHHLVVRYCADLVKIRNPEYAIVGDDIVIPGNRLARKYLEILSELGVPVSTSKSLTGNCIEFCKRIWDGPNEITPLPSKLLLKSRDYRILIQLNEWLSKRGVSDVLRDTLLTLLLPKNENKLRQIILALTAPFARCGWAGAPVREDWRGPPLPRFSYKRVYRHVKIQDLHKVYDNLFRLVGSWITNTDNLKTLRGVPGVSSGCSEFLPHQRVIQLLPEVARRTGGLLDKFRMDPDSYLSEPIPQSLVFDPAVMQPSKQKLALKEMSYLSRVFDYAVKYASQDVIPVTQPTIDVVIDLTDDEPQTEGVPGRVVVDVKDFVPKEDD